MLLNLERVGQVSIFTTALIFKVLILRPGVMVAVAYGRRSAYTHVRMVDQVFWERGGWRTFTRCGGEYTYFRSVIAFGKAGSFRASG